LVGRHVLVLAIRRGIETAGNAGVAPMTVGPVHFWFPFVRHQRGRSMLRTLILATCTAIGLGATSFALAQDAATPPATGELCATPASASASPVGVAMATAVHVPGAQEGPAASPTLLYPCGTPEGTAATSESEVVEVVMVDIDFQPEALTIPANTDLTLHLPNEGTIPHNFKIDDPEVFSGDVASGASADLTLNLPPGSYEYYCTIPGHRPAGMVGTLTME
jgi:uncharacterized cupredoxin-like copper-binding protein